MFCEFVQAIQYLLRLLSLPAHSISFGQVAEVQTGGGRELNRHLRGVDRQIVVRITKIPCREQHVCPGIIGVEIQRFLKLLDRLINPARKKVGGSEDTTYGNGKRVEADRSLAFGVSLFVASQSREQ